MEESTEVKKEYQVLLSENYALDTDKLNLILKERYEKKDGKGKHANVVEGEYGWSILGYFGSLTHVASYLVKHELRKEREVGELRDIQVAVEKLRDDIVNHLNERVEVIKG